jgi:hypothetical protein
MAVRSVTPAKPGPSFAPKELTRTVPDVPGNGNDSESAQAIIPRTLLLQGGPDSCAIRVAKQQAELIW